MIEPGDQSDRRTIEEEIRGRAYEVYLERRGENGSDVEDWLRAEDEYRQRSPVAPKFGSAGSGGAEYERLPEAHNREDRSG